MRYYLEAWAWGLAYTAAGSLALYSIFALNIWPFLVIAFGLAVLIEEARS